MTMPGRAVPAADPQAAAPRLQSPESVNDPVEQDHGIAMSSVTSLHRPAALSEPLIAVAVVFLLYAVSVLIVGIGGDFPLNDDWSYAAAVRGLVFAHDWRPSGWTSSTLITQSLWAAPFCGIGNCDYVSLRASSLLATAISLVLCHVLFSRFRVGAWFQSIALIVVAFNPLSFSLQFTFMTEAVFVMFLLGSVLSFVTFIEDEDRRYYVAGCLLIIGATLCRQLGLCVPLAFAVVWFLLHRNKGLPRTLLVAGFPLALSAAALFLYNHWMRQTGRAPALYDAKNDLVVDALAHPFYLVQRMSWNFSACMLYLGFFTAPLTLGRFCPQSARWPRRGRIVPLAAAGLCGLFFIGVMIVRGTLMPITGNILASSGIGPHLLYYTGTAQPPGLPRPFWMFITLVSLAGAMRIIYIASDFIGHCAEGALVRPDSKKTMITVLLLLAAVAYFVPVLLINFYDRYIMPMVPILCGFLLLATESARPAAGLRDPARLIGTALCVLTVGFSVLATHDFMSWNRARWRAIADLESIEHQTVHSIDGGMEYNSQLYDPDYKPSASKSPWWIDRDTYKLTSAPLPDERIWRKYPYSNFVPPTERFIYVMTTK